MAAAEWNTKQHRRRVMTQIINYFSHRQIKKLERRGEGRFNTYGIHSVLIEYHQQQC